MKLTYTCSELFNLRSSSSCLNYISPHLFSNLKDLGIFRYRGKRGGFGNVNTSHQISRHNSYFTSPSSPSKFLKFRVFNARSINNKSLQIKDYVVENDIDLLAISETWLKSDENSDFVIRDICPSGYFFSHVPRPDRTGGGIGLLYKGLIKIETLQPLNPLETHELIVPFGSFYTYYLEPSVHGDGMTFKASNLMVYIAIL